MRASTCFKPVRLGDMLSERHKIFEHFSRNAFLAGDLFRGLKAESQSFLRAISRRQEFAADETVFAAGAPPDRIYILKEGTAQVLFHGVEPVQLIRNDEILGIPEAVSNLFYETSVQTLAPSRFEYLQSVDFIRFLRDEPEVCFRLLETLGAKLHKLYRVLY